ncbi:MAG: FHA domain-containing protein [Verrucomicrobiota bacterium]
MENKLRLASSENQWLLDKGFYSLGRSRTANLQINRSQASRIHIFFFNDPERGLLVSDAGSSNGAYLNGQLILKPEVLVTADVIDVAGEELHVSFDPSDTSADHQDPLIEPSVLMNVSFNDKGTEWGPDSKLQSRAVGEWFYRSIKLLISHQGNVVQVTDRSITAIWDRVGEQEAQRFQAIVECSRQLNQFAISLNQLLVTEWQMTEGTSLFRAHSSIHYTPVKFKDLASGQLKVLGEDTTFMQDLSYKAMDLNCPIVSSDRFPSQVEDRCAETPMLMAEIGARRVPVVLYPLRVD